jgi:hypothetical protein
VTLTNYIPVLVGLTLILGVLRIFYIFRSRALRILADTWGFQYIGPPAPKWWNPSHPKISPPLPGWFSQVCRPSGQRIRQIWNVIEGRQNGVSVLIFDAIIGEYRGGAACTFIACQTQHNPFGTGTSPDRLIQSHGWTVLHGVWFLWFSWTMGVQQLEHHVKGLRVGCVCEPGS